MAKRMSGLGRGLGALIPQKNDIGSESGSAAGSSSVRKPRTRPSAPAPQDSVVRGTERNGQSQAAFEVALKDIVSNPVQPRKSFGRRGLEELTESIKEHGIIQPLTVTVREKGGYELIAGERRMRAAKILGMEKVPVVVRKAGTRDKLLLALIENIQREDLNPIEEARGYSRLISEFDLTQEDASKRVGKARSTVANTLRLLDLPEEIQTAIAEGVVPAGSARAILSLNDKASQLKFFKKMVAGHMTARDAEAGVRRAKGGKSRKDPVLFAAEERLRDSLGSKVEIKKRGEKGSISVMFYSDEEYQSLIKKMTG